MMTVILALLVVCPMSAQQPQPKPGHAATITVATPTPAPPDDVNMAMNDPDKFAWVLFERVNHLASTQPVLKGVKMNNAVFETWADDGLTFPKCPDPKNPPKWPATAEEASPKHFVPSLKIRIHNTLVGTKIKELSMTMTNLAPEIIPPLDVPPAKSTFPPGSRLAEKYVRVLAMLAAVLHELETGS